MAEPKTPAKPPSEPKPQREEDPAKKAPAKAPAAPAKKPGPAPGKAAQAPPKKAPGTGAKATESKGEDVKIVDKPTPKVHKARAKPALTAALRAGLALRRAIAGRRPRKFKRQQWYEYKRLEDSGWRRPTGVDSAQRRHFGYEQPVVRVGFRGPAPTRGLHPTGYREVYVSAVADVARIDPKTEAARVSATLGARKLKLVYAEADKRGVRVLNRRRLE